MMEELPYEVIAHIMDFLPSIEDRKAASIVCKNWHEAYQSPFLRKKEVLTINSTDVFDELCALSNPGRVFANVCIRGVYIGRRTRNFWRRYAPFIRNLSLNSCDVRENTFMKLITKCKDLEYLNVQDCKELLMSGYLLENPSDREYLKTVLTHVKTLSLGYNRCLTDTLFVRFVSVCPNLEELLLPGCYISFYTGSRSRDYLRDHVVPSDSDLTFSVIYDYIKKNSTRLKVLSFAETLIDCDTLTIVATTPGLQLQKLYLRGCVQITNDAIISMFECQYNMTHLDMGLCPRLTDNSLTGICRFLKRLKFLSIQGCRNITDLGVAELRRLTSLVQLNISECEKVRDQGIMRGLGSRVNLNLRELNMSHLGLITERSIMRLMDLLPNLRVLDLGYCLKGVNDRSVQSIFLRARGLTRLSLSVATALTDRGITGIALELPPTLDNPQTRLRSIMRDIEDYEAVTDEAEKARIQEILSQVDRSWDLRGGCLRQLKSLRRLNLSGCTRLSDLSIKYGLKISDLKCLDISSCPRITNNGLFYISEHNKALETLNIDNCHNIDDEGVGYILSKLKRLKNLTLGSNKITDRILEHLAQSPSNLTFLDVRHCPLITAATVRQIITCYPRLHVIHFSTKGNDFQYQAPNPLPSNRS